MDVWSRHVWVSFAKKKSDVEMLYERWKTEMQTFFRSNVNAISLGPGWTRFFITDGGGEYTSASFEARLKRDGVVH